MSYYRRKDGDNLRLTKDFDELMFKEIEATHDYHFKTFLPSLIRDWINVDTSLDDTKKEEDSYQSTLSARQPLCKYFSCDWKCYQLSYRYNNNHLY